MAAPGYQMSLLWNQSFRLFHWVQAQTSYHSILSIGYQAFSTLFVSSKMASSTKRYSYPSTPGSFKIAPRPSHDHLNYYSCHLLHRFDGADPSMHLFFWSDGPLTCRVGLSFPGRSKPDSSEAAGPYHAFSCCSLHFSFWGCTRRTFPGPIEPMPGEEWSSDLRTTEKEPHHEAHYFLSFALSMSCN